MNSSPPPQQRRVSIVQERIKIFEEKNDIAKLKPKPKIKPLPELPTKVINALDKLSEEKSNNNIHQNHNILNKQILKHISNAKNCM